MRRSPTLLSFTIAASLICTPLMLPGSAHARTLAFVGSGQDAEDPALTEAKALYKEGEVKFQTAEYEDALALWKRAFGILPDGEETRAIRHALVYNIAEAHRRAYEVSRNPAHLRKAKMLLETYRGDHRALYGDEPEALEERAEVDDRIAEIDKMIAASVAAGEEVPVTDNGETTGDGADVGANGPEGGAVAPVVKPLTPQQQWEAEVKADPQLGPKWAQGQKRVVGGAVLTGIGGFFVLISVGAFVSAPAAEFFPGLLWGAGGVTAVIGLGMLIPGAVLIGVGSKQRRDVLQAKPKPIAGVVPMVLPGVGGRPGGGGVGYTLRF